MTPGTDEVDYRWFEETLEDLRSHVERWPLLAFSARIAAELEDGERELELARRSGRDIGIDADLAATSARRALPLIAPAPERADAWLRDASSVDGAGAAAERLLLSVAEAAGTPAVEGPRALRRLHAAEAAAANATQRVIGAPEDESLDIKTALEELAAAQVETGFALKELLEGILLPAANPPRRRGLRGLLGGDPEPERGTELMRAHLDGGDPHHAAADFVSPQLNRDAAWDGVDLLWPHLERWWAGVLSRRRN